ncbi:MAG TPA: hypothetical protein VN660_08245 [Steroidobacteraceae bacterium]|nr:hypothetical protein [Steroidobacteraceae bacterium]
MRLHSPLLAAALCAALMGTAGVASAQITIGVSVHIAPPALPVYVQPVMPSPGYLWVPGYWAWDEAGAYYYWVPGTWVLPPQPGLLWTPGYWGWTDGVYVWHEGYWGPHVGYYGGVDYGFGYGPHGYDGGHWDHGQFYYNTAVTRVGPGVRLRHSYNHPIPGGAAPGHASFNGGRGGVQVRPTPAQLSAGRERHVTPISVQRDLVDSASHDQRLRANFNHGHPGVAATPRPEAFARQGGEAARVPEHGAHAEGGRRPARGSPQGQRPAARGFAPGNESRPQGGAPAARGFAPHAPGNEVRPQGNAHGAPSFAPREHVPSTPRGEAHAAPHGGTAHTGVSHAAGPRSGGGSDGGNGGKGQERQRPPRG